MGTVGACCICIDSYIYARTLVELYIPTRCFSLYGLALYGIQSVSARETHVLNPLLRDIEESLFGILLCIYISPRDAALHAGSGGKLIRAGIYLRVPPKFAFSCHGYLNKFSE